jgi:predicted DNA-binding protein
MVTALYDFDDVGGKTNLARVTVYIEPEAKEKLERLAKAEKRTMSNLISVLIDNAIEEAEAKGKIEPS